MGCASTSGAAEQRQRNSGARPPRSRTWCPGIAHPRPGKRWPKKGMGKIHHAMKIGKLNYFDWAIFNSKLLVYQRVHLNAYYIYIPLDWWVGTRAPPFHKNLVYVMVGYRYICIEWILFWAYILWNTTIVLPSRPDMQRNASPVCYGNGKKMNSWNQENLTCILWNWLFFEGVILRYLKIF